MDSGLGRAALSALVLIISALSLSPVQAEDAKTAVASSALPGLPINSDPAFQSAVDYIRESKAARERQERRRDMHAPAAQEKIVRTHDNARTYILGGGAAIPM